MSVEPYTCFSKCCIPWLERPRSDAVGLLLKTSLRSTPRRTCPHHRSRPCAQLRKPMGGGERHAVSHLLSAGCTLPEGLARSFLTQAVSWPLCRCGSPGPDSRSKTCLSLQSFCPAAKAEYVVPCPGQCRTSATGGNAWRRKGGGSRRRAGRTYRAEWGWQAGSPPFPRRGRLLLASIHAEGPREAFEQTPEGPGMISVKLPVPSKTSLVHLRGLVTAVSFLARARRLTAPGGNPSTLRSHETFHVQNTATAPTPRPEVQSDGTESTVWARVCVFRGPPGADSAGSHALKNTRASSSGARRLRSTDLGRLCRRLPRAPHSAWSAFAETSVLLGQKDLLSRVSTLTTTEDADIQRAGLSHSLSSMV